MWPQAPRIGGLAGSGGGTIVTPIGSGYADVVGTSREDPRGARAPGSWTVVDSFGGTAPALELRYSDENGWTALVIASVTGAGIRVGVGAGTRWGAGLAGESAQWLAVRPRSVAGAAPYRPVLGGGGQAPGKGDGGGNVILPGDAIGRLFGPFGGQPLVPGPPRGIGTNPAGVPVPTPLGTALVYAPTGQPFRAAVLQDPNLPSAQVSYQGWSGPLGSLAAAGRVLVTLSPFDIWGWGAGTLRLTSNTLIAITW